MNNKLKFHSPVGPAFNPGELWVPCSGSGNQCRIISVRKYGAEKWDHEVTYTYEDGQQSSKDVWNFQVRYMHIADTVW